TDLRDAFQGTDSATGLMHLACAYAAAGQYQDAAVFLADARDNGLESADLHPKESARLAELEDTLTRHDALPGIKGEKAVGGLLRNSHPPDHDFPKLARPGQPFLHSLSCRIQRPLAGNTFRKIFPNSTAC
ncbi:MAG: hypothetical protein KDA89_03770, partial [Planctomycetaceae bacterium]|nr:hypothetical protein [Planctomycetaceae bacterium]